MQNQLADGFYRRSVSRFRDWFGLLLLLAYAFTGMLWPDVADSLISLILLIGFVGFFWFAGEQRRSGAVQLLALAVVSVLLSWGLSHLDHPDWAESSPKVHRLTHWFTFIAIAWWLAGNTTSTFMIWLAALVGLLSAPWILGNGWSDWQAGLAGRRVSFGIHNAQHTSMLFAIALIGLLVFLPRLARCGKWPWMRVFLGLAAALACGTVVLISQTRGVWLGVLVAMVVMVIILLTYHASRKPSPRNLLFLGLGILMVPVVLVLTLKPVVEKRLSYEHQTIINLLDGDVEGNFRGSVGIRIQTWLEAVDWIKQRPLVGWGGNGRGLIFEHSSVLPERVKKRFGHLHNSYLDTWVNFGLLGLGVLIGLLAWVTRQAFIAWREARLPGDILLFYCGFLAFWLVVNLFESYMYFSSGAYVLALVLGGVVTHIWRAEPAQIPGASE